MPAEDEDMALPEEEHGEFVPVVYARLEEDVERYCQLLEDHGIPARVGDEEEIEDELDEAEGELRRSTVSHGVPILVPEEMLDDASEVIADREEFEDLVEDEEEGVDEEDEETEGGPFELEEEDLEDEDDDDYDPYGDDDDDDEFGLDDDDEYEDEDEDY